MPDPVRILIQTTIPTVEDDWHVGRFALMTDYLRSLRDEAGAPMFAITARDREAPPGEPDPVLINLDASDFKELWLFAVDTGDGLTPEECAAISRFRARGGGMMVTRDHMDLGSSVCTLGGVGKAHFFHTKNPDPDQGRWKPDDVGTPQILWPNYHSGANGDFQVVTIAAPPHVVLADPDAPGGVLAFLPSHPHEGAVGVPADEPGARVIATGVSQTTGQSFNLAVAFEAQPDGAGPAVAQSTFHHFADYNWDPRTGAPTFVSEPPSDRILTDPRGRRSVERYVRNLAIWLASGAEGTS
jgi:hypothetical protein